MTTGTDAPPGSDRRVGAAAAPCIGEVEVHAVYGNDADATPPYRQNSQVRVGGQVRITLTNSAKGFSRTITTTNGKALFREVPCGTVTAQASFTGDSKVLAAARSVIGYRDWAYAAKTTSFDKTITQPAGTNKCNMFIYDMIQAAYGSAPTYSYYRGGIEFWPFKNTVPALAKSWAIEDNSAADPTPGWTNVAYRNKGHAVPPGSILGIRIPYADASGHVAVISTPLDASASARLTGSSRIILDVVMPGRTISATSDSVVENDWGFRTRTTPELNSLNSPSAGIEVRK